MATVVTNTGLALITDLLTGSGTAPKYVGWGTGAGTSAVTDTTLFTEDTTAGYARATGTPTQVTTTTTNDTFQVVGTLTAGATLTITNVGLFNVLTSTPTLVMKADFTGVALNSGDSIQFTLQIEF